MMSAPSFFLTFLLFKECGIDMGDEFNQAYRLYANKDTPDEIVQIVQKAVKETMEDPATVEAFETCPLYRMF